MAVWKQTTRLIGYHHQCVEDSCLQSNGRDNQLQRPKVFWCWLLHQQRTLGIWGHVVTESVSAFCAVWLPRRQRLPFHLLTEVLFDVWPCVWHCLFECCCVINPFYFSGIQGHMCQLDAVIKCCTIFWWCLGSVFSYFSVFSTSL